MDNFEDEEKKDIDIDIDIDIDDSENKIQAINGNNLEPIPKKPQLNLFKSQSNQIFSNTLNRKQQQNLECIENDNNSKHKRSASTNSNMA